MDNQNLKDILDLLDHVDIVLHDLIQISVDKLGAFCSFYPIEAQEKLKTMRFIIDAEINGINIAMNRVVADKEEKEAYDNSKKSLEGQRGE